MPELPDIELYLEALRTRVNNTELVGTKISNPFLLRTVTPGIEEFTDCKVTSLRRIGKRIAVGFENDHWLVIHLMIAGRLHWIDKNKKLPARKPLLSLEFTNGYLQLTEAGSKRRASLHLFTTEADMLSIDRGGLEIFKISQSQFKQRLTIRNHTLKRALTDQSLFSGIGNAYSDEILHHARLSPILQTQKMSESQITRLYKSCVTVLEHWTKILLAEMATETGNNFPKKVTAFKEQMAVHGKYGRSCPVCETKVQRIRYASNETNYCPRCQTDGKLLADRSLSRLLKKDWPKTIEALEESTPVVN